MSLVREHPEALSDQPVVYESALAIPTQVIRKSEWLHRAQMVIDTLLEGVDAVTAFIIIKQINEITGVALGSNRDLKLEKSIVDLALFRLQGSSQEVMGVTVKLKSLARKYLYDDAELASLEVQAEEIKAKIKARQEFLQSLKEDQILPGGVEVKKAQCIAAGVTLSATFPK